MMMRFIPLVMIILLSPLADADEFESAWPEDTDRVWPGPDYWPNPLQDWHVANGRLECRRSGGDRNVHLLTRDVGPGSGSLYLGVKMGRLGTGEGWAGFMIGLRGQFDDYRDTAVRGRGLHCGVSSDGRLFIGKPDAGAPSISIEEMDLRLEAVPSEGGYRISLSALDAKGDVLAQTARSDIPSSWLKGGLALACCAGEIYETPVHDEAIKARGWGMRKTQKRGGDLRFWFKDWKVGGTKVVRHDDRAFGPVLFALHTLDRGIMKMTAQMAPVGKGRNVRLKVGNNEWEAPIDPLARTATFRIPKWDASMDTPYQLVYSLDGRDWAYRGTIRKDPEDKKKIVVAAFTGNNDFGFPHQGVFQGVSHFDPDLLVFTGDQIYEGVAGFGMERQPVEVAALDYLRKWTLLGWAFGDLIKDRPTVCLPDDHDVYHGNIWGAGGRKASRFGAKGQDEGGYTMDAEWVKMVHRTQTSHMPDPFDPTPVEQGIPVYYTSLNVGGVSFAVIEDRKWKSPPKLFLPQAEIHNGWPQNAEYNAAAEGHAPGAELLGRRQLDFLEHWASDWSHGTWMKAVISQTLFANVATLPKSSTSDGVTQGLKIMPPGGYAEEDKIVMDHDSNGWPQTGRNKALRAMRRGFAVHIAGDQHLGSTIQYGVDDWNDAAYAICVPSISNIFPRRWFPPEAGRNHRDGAPKYTGEFLDGFGNKITVHAVSNPHTHGVEPAEVNNRSPGYGIITFDRETRKITFANWPKWVDPRARSARPYPGWPVTVDQMENYNTGAKAYLPTLKVSGMADPVIQVIRERDSGIVYTIRIRGSLFEAEVFEEGEYTLKIGEPGSEKYRVLEHVASIPSAGGKIIEVDLLQ